MNDKKADAEAGDEAIEDAQADEEASFVDRLQEALENLTQLTITTEVVEDSGEKKPMNTIIDLIDGDIKNEIHRDFVTGDLKELRDFHETQVTRGQEIIRENIAALKAIWEFFNDRNKGNP